MIEESSLTAYTAQIVAAHVGRSPTAPADLPALIRNVYQALTGVEASERQTLQGVGIAAAVPRVPIDQSIMPGYIICLEDGKHLKMLKRYLMTQYGLTPEQYRKKWGLPDDYPMVAPEVSERRSMIAKANGLGNGASQGKLLGVQTKAGVMKRLKRA